MRFLWVAALLFALPVQAEITEGGRGLLFGADHAFDVTAREGWVLDNESGVSQGVHMLFYPVGSTWTNSPVIVYGRSVSRDEVPTVAAQVADTVAQFHDNGSTQYRGKRRAPIRSLDGQPAEVYHFSGDQWGNYEAVTYFAEKDTINFLVFNSRTKENFDRYLPDFLQIARTYQNHYRPPTAGDNALRGRLKREADALLEKPGGKAYEKAAIQAVGDKIAMVARGCTAYFEGQELASFQYFVRLGKDGRITEDHVIPSSAMAICFRGMMAHTLYPEPPLDSFVLELEMKFVD